MNDIDDRMTLYRLQARVAKLEALIDYWVQTTVGPVPHDFKERTHVKHAESGKMHFLPDVWLSDSDSNEEST